MLKKVAYLLCLLPVCLMSQINVQVKPQDLSNLIPVEATARVPASLPNADKEALLMALREAVMNAAGLEIEGGTAVINNDTKLYIEARTNGYVERWEEIDKKIENDFLILKIKAFVKKIPLNKDLLIANLPVKAIYEWVGKPRIGINIEDKVVLSAESVPQQYVQNITSMEFEKLLLEKGITVINLPAKEWKERAPGELQIGIEGNSSTIFLRTFPLRSVTGNESEIYVFQNTLTLKAIEYPGGRILLSETYDDIVNDKNVGSNDININDIAGLSREEAIAKAIKRNAQQHGTDFVRKLIRTWYLEMNKPRRIMLKINNVNSGEIANRIYRKLLETDDMANVWLRFQNMNTLEYELEFRGTSERCAGLIETNIPDLTRVKFAENQIEYNYGQAQHPPVKPTTAPSQTKKKEQKK